MHITKVELEDIKSHVDSTYEFPRGTTAIRGENGAGKTTIIEAIAWALFDLLDYKKDDFVRRGAKKGVARITFESGLDEREYTVYRDTGTGYYVYDPRLKTRVADKKEEVTRFLWPHLGLEAGTDLEALFRRAIGVPQGTFTAIFLESQAERKRAFDKLLKVEEYRQGAEKLRDTARFIDGRIGAAREQIARAEGELSRLDSVEAEHSELVAKVAAAEKELAEMNEKVDELARSEKELAGKEAAENAARKRLEECGIEKAKAEIVLGQRRAEASESDRAAEIVAAVKPDAETYTAAAARIKELERERSEREKLRAELVKVETAAAAVRSDLKHARESLEKVLSAHQALSDLQALITQQDNLEAAIDKLRTRTVRSDTAASRIAELKKDLERQRERYRENQEAIAAARDKAKGAEELAVFESRDRDLVVELANLRASLQRDEKFQQEVRNGLCPILSQKCLNLGPGESLESFIQDQFVELRSKISELESERVQVATRLESSRNALRFVADHDVLLKRQEQLKEEGLQKRKELAELEKGWEDPKRLKVDMHRLTRECDALGDPKGKARILRDDLRREPELRENITTMERNAERLESDRRLLAEQMESFKDLDPEWAKWTAESERTAEAYRSFISNERLASFQADRKTALANAEQEMSEIEKAIESAAAEHQRAASEYDRERHQAEKAALLDLEKRRAESRASHSAFQQRAAQLGAELDRLSGIRTAMRAELKERERLERVSDATAFIRDTLKEAAPRVARNYVYHVSVEANQLFREITGNAEHSLKWCEDYAIVLEEGGYERPFASLSGGEQMAAALAIRLVLLKQLSDIRIAFFDEPTANMDAERRENLANQISRITHFDQLFIISHDDTFEGYVDNVVTVGD